MKEVFKPFDNDSQSINLGPDNGFTLENGTDEIKVYCDFTITTKTDYKNLEDIIEVLNIVKNNLMK